jgi:hypothetical protein
MASSGHCWALRRRGRVVGSGCALMGAMQSHSDRWQLTETVGQNSAVAGVGAATLRWYEFRGTVVE